MELSIDTSTELVSLALSEQGVPRAELTWTAGLNHTTELLPGVQALLRQAGTELQHVKAVFVAIGPGAFNGVRVGMSTAKGLAFSLDVPLVGVSTLEVEAYPFAPTGLPVCPLHDAGRHELAAALYQQTGGEWRRLKEEHLTNAENLCAQTRSRTVFCGEIPPGVSTYLATRLADLAVIPDAAIRLRRAGSLAALGWARLRRGLTDDIATLQPLYLRRPHITIPKPQC